MKNMNLTLLQIKLKCECNDDTKGEFYSVTESKEGGRLVNYSQGRFCMPWKRNSFLKSTGSESGPFMHFRFSKTWRMGNINLVPG